MQAPFVLIHTFVVGAVLLMSAPAAAQSFPFTADVLFYTTIDSGACSFGVIQTSVAPFGLIAAADSAIFGGSAACGRFIEIDTAGATCPAPPCGFTGSRVLAMISDTTPETPPLFDLAQAAFEVLAPASEGRLDDVGWRYVPGTHAGNIRVESTASSNSFFYEFVIFDHNLGITQVEIRSSGSSTWQTASRNTANHFSVTGGAPLATPLSIRLTDIEGGVTTAIDVILSVNGAASADLGVQMQTGTPVPAGPVVGHLLAVALAVGGTVVLRRARRAAAWTALICHNHL